MNNIPIEVVAQLEVEKRLLEQQIFDAQKKLKEIDMILSNLGGRRKNNWSKYILMSLSTQHRPMTTNDFLQEIFSNAPGELTEPSIRRSRIMQLSLVLNRLCKARYIKGISPKGFKGKVYGLYEWFENDEFTEEYGRQLDMIIQKNKAINTKNKQSDNWNLFLNA